MAATDRTATATESDLLDIAEDIIAGYFEDGERREDIGNRYGIPALATAQITSGDRKGSLELRFQNGETWDLNFTATVTKRVDGGDR